MDVKDLLQVILSRLPHSHLQQHPPAVNPSSLTPNHTNCYLLRGNPLRILCLEKSQVALALLQEVLLAFETFRQKPCPLRYRGARSPFRRFSDSARACPPVELWSVCHAHYLRRPWGAYLLPSAVTASAGNGHAALSRKEWLRRDESHLETTGPRGC